MHPFVARALPARALVAFGLVATGVACATFASSKPLEAQVAPPGASPGSADASHILPHRLELEETTLYANDSTDLNSYTFVTVDGAQGWGEPQLAIDWMALTWNGTGFDRNLVARAGLDLRGRITPSGVPFGYLVGSHYFDESNVVDADPDGELHRYRSFSDSAEAQYNEIVLPYLLASLDLAEGMRVVVPTFSEYRPRAPRRYSLLVVREPVVIVDDHGHHHRGWRVDGAGAATLEEVAAMPDDLPEAHRRYFVSSVAPYFLGKEWIGTSDREGRTVEVRWRLSRHQTLSVSPSSRLEEILRLRARRGAGQEIPWHPDAAPVRSGGSGPPSAPDSGR